MNDGAHMTPDQEMAMRALMEALMRQRAMSGAPDPAMMGGGMGQPAMMPGGGQLTPEMLALLQAQGRGALA